jgi:hypothetical protein
MEYGKYQKGLYNGVDQRAINQLAMSGFADFAEVDISDSSFDEETSLADLFGTDKLFRAVKSTDDSDGVLLVKTLNNYSNGYVAYPLKSGEKDLLLTPITHIKKTGSISGIIIFWQNIG